MPPNFPGAVRQSEKLRGGANPTLGYHLVDYIVVLLDFRFASLEWQPRTEP